MAGMVAAIVVVVAAAAAAAEVVVELAVVEQDPTDFVHPSSRMMA